jgi:hypothetical protein
MNIYTAFTPDQYCVYHTTYSGTLLPQNYIGSTSVDNVLNNNYHGSVGSERYKAIWKSELQLHPELFSTVIVSYHDTRSNATWKELQVQRTLNVVKSDLFINRAYASVNGFQDTIFSPEEKAVTAQKGKATRLRNGTLNNSTPESIQKCKDTKSINGTGNGWTPESIQKTKDAKLRNGTTNTLTVAFLSMIHNKKTYAKNAISKYFSDLKQYY